MISKFKFFQKNIYKNKCRLQIGSSFIFRGNYCIVNRMWNDWFEFTQQDNDKKYYMKYENYLKTPSAAGRQLNRI